ncbi:4'-phosphopantetheinyl transferase superfamily protein [Rathayibacter iranicus NCPPB 2253 = VKM Ac-1602]|nr:4'-phosphopantetheinyl transferase superfamily protein [Rathayibacter iranicus NCPPB 2253 = VKM Ac-1602]
MKTGGLRDRRRTQWVSAAHSLSTRGVRAIWREMGFVAVWGRSGADAEPRSMALALAGLLPVATSGRLSLARLATGAPVVRGTSALTVSFSRAPGMWAFALGRQPIGVDIERERQRPMESATHGGVFCSRGEIAAVEALPPHVRGTALLSIWALKEAAAKARGHGLSSDFPTWTAWPTERATIPRIDRSFARDLTPSTVVAVAVGTEE